MPGPLGAPADRRQLRVLVVLDREPSRHASTSDGSSLISHDLLRHLPPTWSTTVVSALPPDDRPRWRRAIDRGMIGESARMVAPSALAHLRPLARTHDVAYLHGPATLSLVGALSPLLPVVFNYIDLMSVHHQRTATLGTAPVERLEALGRAWRARRRERSASGAAVTIFVNEDEAHRWEAQTGRRAVAIPNGVDRPAATWEGADSHSLLFLGTLDYLPNIDSARTLVRDVLPLVRRHCPGTRLDVVGRRPSAAVLSLGGEGVAVHADVPDVGPFLANAALAVFPDRLGSGIRNSLLEALAVGCPVVASPHAARRVPPGPHLRVADGPSGLADAVVSMLADREALAAAAEAARAFGAQLPTPEAMAARYVEVIEAAAVSTPSGPDRAPDR